MRLKDRAREDCRAASHLSCTLTRRPHHAQTHCQPQHCHSRRQQAQADRRIPLDVLRPATRTSASLAWCRPVAGRSLRSNPSLRKSRSSCVGPCASNPGAAHTKFTPAKPSSPCQVNEFAIALPVKKGPSTSPSAFRPSRHRRCIASNIHRHRRMAGRRSWHARSLPSANPLTPPPSWRHHALVA